MIYYYSCKKTLKLLSFVKYKDIKSGGLLKLSGWPLNILP